ncbi:hypothetical protein K2Q00_03895 [Patescibacteria group bacterium]|nr:hypothetical protein [Patescibacteria group bacterium]
MGRNNDFGYFLVIMLSAFWLMSIGFDAEDKVQQETQLKIAAPKSMTIEEEMVAVGITCPDCPNIPDGMIRVYKDILPGGGVVETPNLSYLEFLEQKCATLRRRHFSQMCQGHIDTVRRIHPHLSTVLNPTYGGTPNFTPEMIGWLLWYSNGAKRHLRDAEGMAVGFHRDLFIQKKYHRQEPG